MDIFPIACLHDNYAWLLAAADGRRCAVVDPGEAGPVAAAIAGRGLRLAAILLTHHHADHIGGVAALCGGADPPEVYGAAADAARLPPLTHPLGEGATCAPLGRHVACLATPGHTRHALCFYDAAAAALFTGDTLFAGGCGRLFEGSAAQMQASLARLAALPAATGVYCGHEYTERNLEFACSVLEMPALRARLAAVRRARAAGLPSVPTPLAEELRTNLFLRAEDPALQAAMGVAPGPDAAALTWVALRRRRDAF